jgi:hypothetical protein
MFIMSFVLVSITSISWMCLWFGTKGYDIIIFSNCLEHVNEHYDHVL